MPSESDMIKICYGKWKGGYYEGDPLDPYGISTYGQMGFISILHAVYQVCIKPYIKSDTVVLEIGPGRGTWTKTMLNAKEIWCLDVLSAKNNKFWEYIGSKNKGKVNYIQVKDFSCSDLPEEHFDFLFSFGTFCHIPVEGQHKYYRNIYSKIRKGGTAMVMFSDLNKYNTAVKNFGKVSFWKFDFGLKNIVRSIIKLLINRDQQNFIHRTYDFLYKKDENKNKWFHAGIEETCQFLESVGWEIVNPDVGLCIRDPIIHFKKPS
ncbi:MAG: class I SAM-dependent methyltransferase [Candidatus Helarchaeota archaeon]|nr:class I SAM-dependent methyltransferase [Candidatus Helarchaeota archaeon]